MDKSESAKQCEWFLILNGQEPDRVQWLRSFPEMFDPAVQSHDSLVLLRIDALQECGTADEVQELGLPMLDKLNGAMSAIHHCDALRFEGVGYFDENGQLKRHVFATAEGTLLRAYLSATGVTLNSDGSVPQSPPPQPSKVQAWFAKAMTDDDTGDFLYHVGNANNWYELYKAIEMLETIVGGERKLREALASKVSGWKTMRTTANYHRHARGHRPTQLTDFRTAKSLVRQAATVVIDADEHQ